MNIFGLAKAVVITCMLLASIAYAADCRKTGEVCVDTTPGKYIGDVYVTLAQAGGCWNYEVTYSCLKPNAVNYCQPFIDAQPGCWQTNSVCDKWDTTFGTGCMQYTQTWRCGDPNKPTPTNTTRLNETYTLVSNDYDTAKCSAQSQNSNCKLAESKCTSTTPPALPPGISPSSVAPDGCYERQDTYVCLTGKSDVSECSTYSSNPNCSLQSTSCDPEDVVNGQCTYQRSTYQCMTSPATTTTTTDCSGQQFCSGGACFDRGHAADKDFGLTMAMMETSRQGGVYGNPNNLFGGEDSKCTVKLGGLSNCCKAEGGGQGFTNGGLMGVAASAGGQAVKYGSYYVYDSLMANNAQFLAKGVGAISGATEAAVRSGSTAVAGFTPSLGMYGFSVSFGAAPAGATVLGSAGNMTFAFDPTSLAMSIAIMVVMDFLSCDQNEQLLGLKKGQNLCHYVGDYCSSKFLGVCLEKTQGYCCYNSRLARIINEQGRPQLGKGWGSAEHPQCDGFTQDEFSHLDFSRIDMSEFINDVMSRVVPPNGSGLSSGVQNSVQTKIQNYYDQGGK